MEKCKKKAGWDNMSFALSLGNKGTRAFNRKSYFLWASLSLWVPFGFDFMSSKTKAYAAEMDNNPASKKKNYNYSFFGDMFKIPS